MENFKRSAKRLLTRLTILGLVVICGAIAIAQVQRQNNANAADGDPITAAPKQLAFAGDLQGIESLPPQPSTGIPAMNEMDLPAATSAAPAFVRDDNIVLAQATSDAEFSNQFDSPFGAESSEVDGADPGPPRFDQPPSFDAAPEFINQDAAPIANGPEAPSASNFADEFPDDAFPAAAFPPAEEAAVDPPAAARPASRFAPTEPAADATAPVAENNRLRFGADPTASAAPDTSANVLRSGNPSRFDAAASTPAPRFGEPARQPEPNFGATARQTAPTPNFGSAEIAQSTIPETPALTNDYGGFGNQPSADAPGSYEQLPPAQPAQANRVSIAATGNPAPEYEGPQNAAISVYKQAPRQVHVDEVATFTVKIRNNGNVAADRVIIRDQVPKRSRLVKTVPQAKEASNGGVYWEIGTLAAKQEMTVSMDVIPDEEGVIGSVAEVSFVTLASAQADVRRPMLKITHSTEPQVLSGETVRFTILIDNPGSGTAKDVIVEEDVPRGLAHSKGGQLQHKVGDIPPGGQRRLELSLKAAEPGPVTNVIRARAANDLVAEHTTNLEVVAPQLAVQIDGPSTRYLERKATYSVQLQNRGTAKATNIDLRLQLPSGVKFVNTESKGRYEASTHSIRWLLRELEANRGASVEFTIMPQQAGQFNFSAIATADRNLRDETEQPLSVEGIAALLFEVADQVDPIDIGGITTYNIQVTNQGTKEASNVQFLAQVPPGMEAVAPNGVANYQIQGDIVRFQPIARLAAKEKTSYKIQVRGRAAGDQRFKVQMTSAETTTPVIEEESTRVLPE